MESNINHPLAFFEDFLTKDNIKYQLKSFYKDSLEHESVDYIDHDKKLVVIHSQNENGDYISEERLFADIINRKLNIQSKITKHLINEASAKYQNSKEEFTNYLMRQKETIRYINLVLEPLLIQYPYLITALENINEYMSKKYSYQGSTSQTKNVNASPEDLVLSIFSFMKGKNDSRNQIMDEAEYNLMISYITAFIKDDRVPPIHKKINNTNINNELLRFLFWILHHEFYTTLRIKNNFFEFMTATFKQFDSVTHNTLRSKFANKSNLSHKSYLPEIVNFYLEKQSD